jgi:spore coat protein U-like protein
MTKFISCIATVAAAIAFGVTGAYATTSTGILNVSATVAASCTVGAQPLNFGVITGALPANPKTITANTAIGVNCTQGLAYTVGLGSGLNGNRYMKAANSTAKIPYDLYTDSSFTSSWTAISGGNTPGTTGNSNTQSLVVYGAITAAGGNLPADTYSDQVIITVSY